MFTKKEKALPTKKKKGKSGFRKVNDWLHLWLGLTSGIIVFIVSITGCIYAFEKEIRSVTQKYQFVEPQDKPFLPPSQLKQLAAQYAFGNQADSNVKKIASVGYGGKDKAVAASFTDKKKGFTSVYMNPYTGAFLHTKVFEDDFFRFILEGHFNLWLPRKIGQPIVASATLIFVILLISGLIMWWPKNLKKANREKSFMIKWKAGFKRVNYDLHNVLGFYVMAVALLIAMTGLVWGFKWWARSTYWVTSGGKSLQEFKRPFSDTTVTTASFANGEDIVWKKAMNEHYKESGYLTIQIPIKASDAYGVMFNPDEGTHYRRQFHYFDRNTLARLKGGGVYAKPFEEAAMGDRIARMNYDIHVGAVLGLPGKILAFLASLICASLPITGFLVWWGKKKKKKSKPVAKTAEKASLRVVRAAVNEPVELVEVKNNL